VWPIDKVQLRLKPFVGLNTRCGNYVLQAATAAATTTREQHRQHGKHVENATPKAPKAETSFQLQL